MCLFPHLVMNWRYQVIYDIVEGAFLYFVHQMIFTHCDRQMRQRETKGVGNPETGKDGVSYSEVLKNNHSGSIMMSADQDKITQASKSENKKIGYILKKENSEWVDPSQVRAFSVDEVFELMDATKKPTITSSEVIEKYGKAFAGLLDYNSSGKERVTFYYKLSDQQGFFKIVINEFEGKSRVERVYLEVTKAQAGMANKTLEEYRSYLPKSGQEGIGLMEAISQFGIPKNSYSNNLYEGENSYIYILYFTTDQRKITLSFKKNQQGEYRLENVATSG